MHIGPYRLFTICHFALYEKSPLHHLHNDIYKSFFNTLYTLHPRLGKSENAMHCFDEMQKNGFSPNAVSFTCILKACGSIGALEKGKQIHEDIVNRALLGKHIELGNSLVDMYAKCGAFTQAKQVLDKLLHAHELNMK